MARVLSSGARVRLVEMADAWTKAQCRRRRIKCMNKATGEYTAQAQEFFNQAYDHFEAVILDFRSK